MMQSLDHLSCGCKNRKKEVCVCVCVRAAMPLGISIKGDGIYPCLFPQTNLLPVCPAAV